MILTNCRLIPELCEGFAEEYADIRVEGNIIAEILPAGGKYVGEEVVNCEGKTILPGLFNLHNHLFFDNMPNGFRRHTEYEQIVGHMRYMHELLSYGFTTLRDVGGPYNIAIKLRNDINAGKIVGPNMTASGYILVPTQIAPDLEAYAPDYGLQCDSPDQVRAAVRTVLKDGADFIKILGDACVPGKRKGFLFYPDELEALNEAVRREGTYLAIHTTSEEANEISIELEAYSIEHGNMWSQKNTDDLIAHGMKSCIVPTMQVAHALGGEEFAIMANTGLRMAYDAGALMGFGTDAFEAAFLSMPHCEYVMRSKIWGISNIEILKQATINSAKIIGVDDIRGTIKIGKRADFAIVDGNPDKDLTVFSKPCAYVIKDGVVVAREGMVRFI